MLKVLFLALFINPLLYAQVHPELAPELINAPYPISRYIRTIPIHEAHSYRGTARFQNLDSNKVDILVWNVQKLKQKSWKEEFENFSENKDLILLQEAYENDLFIDSTQNLIDLRWDFAKSFEYLLFGVTTGSMIGSNTQPASVNVLHSPDREHILETPKATMITYYQLSGHEHRLMVISIHGINFTTNKPFYRQLNQIFSHIDNHQGPVIFAGDFNTHNKARFNYLKRETLKRGLNNLDFLNSHLRKKFSGNILDYTFARDVEVIESYVPSHTKGSDHPPMILSVKIKDLK